MAEEGRLQGMKDQGAQKRSSQESRCWKLKLQMSDRQETPLFVDWIQPV